MLETKIEALTTAVNQLIAVMSSGQAVVPAAVQAAPPAPPVAAFAPPAPAMPAPPSFGPPAEVAPAAPQAPFNDQPGLYAYCQATYKADLNMGPKMEMILKQLTPTGEASQVRPDQYGAFFAAVEAAKV